MSVQTGREKKRFYLVSTDVLQGISVFLMVIGHTSLWWDSTLDAQYPNLPLFPLVLLRLAFLVPPGFLFWYTFNTVNSLLRRKNSEERLEMRTRLLKRALIFFLIAEFSEIMAGLITSPENVLSFVFNWQLFHMFALATLLPLLVFEIGWKLEIKRKIDLRLATLILFFAIMLVVLIIYLIFHDYSESIKIELYTELNLQSILQRIFLEDGQSPIFPYLSFSAAGGFLASFFNFPNTEKKATLQRAPLALLIGLGILILGILFTSIEQYISTPVGYPSSSPFVLISIGVHILSTTGLIFLIDINSMFGNKQINKLLLPLVLLSKITLTVYLAHNILYIIPPDIPLIQALIPNIYAILIFGFLYTVFFVLIAIIWSSYKFRFSLEWIVWKFQGAKWRS
jgi:hypothetical protein